MMSMLRVAVIGSGAAGLSAARHLLAKPYLFQPVVYEQTGRVGGTWVYVEETGTDQHGLPIHSSMYQNLKTNLPKEIMKFPDFPFKEDLPSFIGHVDVLQYLEDYANHFNLLKYTKFWTCVESVTPLQNCDDERMKWVVTVKNLKNKTVETNTFDAVLVCNGHYAVPHPPQIIGLNNFSGHYIHCHEYRHPENYKDQIVAVLGAGPSGIDVALEVANFSKQVLLCHWTERFTVELPKNLKQTAAIKSIKNGNILVGDDGGEYSVDAIIACTGYEYSFPFLTPECQVTVNDKHIEQLYMHLIHMVYPTMYFIGITYRICPFPQFDLQVKFVLGVLEGTIKLPSRAVMEKEENEALDRMIQNGEKKHFYHYLGDKQWRYHDLLAKRGCLEEMPSILEDIYGYIKTCRKKDILDYKTINIKVTGESWDII